LAESAKVHLWQFLQSPQPGFQRFAQICREAHRRGKPELLLHAAETLTPARTATDQDLRVLLRSHAELRAALVAAGKEIVKLNFGRRDSAVLAMLRRCLQEAREVAARFMPQRMDE
jgi:hypothetical protein